MALVIDRETLKVKQVKNLRWLLEKKKDIRSITFFSLPNDDRCTEGFMVAHVKGKKVYVCTWADFYFAAKLVSHSSFSRIPVDWQVNWQ